jgi:hypothetical protein
MKRLIYGGLSSLVILLSTVPVQAQTPALVVAQSNSTIERMFREQRAFVGELETIMAEIKIMKAQMKALMALPEGKPATMEDIYKQQQLLSAQMETLLLRNRLNTIPPRTSTATMQEVYQQQVAMMDEMKGMMTEMKKMIEIYRGRAGVYRPQ